MEHEDFMYRAIRLAERGMKGNHGGPFGAVVVKNGSVIGKGFNRVVELNHPSNHAEVVAIDAAGETSGSFDLSDSILYTSCEPCPMCLFTALWARIGMIYYAATRKDADRIGFRDDVLHTTVDMKKIRQIVTMKKIMRREAVAVMQGWLRKADRKEY